MQPAENGEQVGEGRAPVAALSWACCFCSSGVFLQDEFRNGDMTFEITLDSVLPGHSPAPGALVAMQPGVLGCGGEPWQCWGVAQVLLG